jgi:hypothetical protein
MDAAELAQAALAAVSGNYVPLVKAAAAALGVPHPADILKCFATTDLNSMCNELCAQFAVKVPGAKMCIDTFQTATEVQDRAQAIVRLVGKVANFDVEGKHLAEDLGRQWGDLMKIPGGDQQEQSFARLHPNVRRLADCTNSLTNTSPYDRAYLMSSLIASQTSPDVVVPVQHASRLSRDGFEERSVNYVIQRFVSAGVKSTLDDVLLNSSNLAGRFTYGPNIEQNWMALEERLLSLLLGYKYPYLAKERPRTDRHLHLDTVIPFLYRHKDSLTKLEASQVSQSTSGDQHCISLEKRIDESYLFQAVCQAMFEVSGGTITKKSISDAASGEAFDASKKTKADILNWYDLWDESAENEGSQRLLNSALINYLLESRSSASPRLLLQKEVQDLRDQVEKWEKFKHYLLQFKDLVAKHSKDLLSAEDPQQLPAAVQHAKPALALDRFDAPLGAAVVPKSTRMKAATGAYTKKRKPVGS